LQHIRGVENHLADILSRNPAGLEVNEIQDLTKPTTISVNKIELKTDQAVLKNFKKLADKQKNDTKLRIIRDKAENDPADNNNRIGHTVSNGQTRSKLEGDVARMLRSTHHPIRAYVARTRRS
jgi:hypothetical protein